MIFFSINISIIMYRTRIKDPIVTVFGRGVGGPGTSKYLAMAASSYKACGCPSGLGLTIMLTFSKHFLKIRPHSGK
jgi:hypothetical protein